MPDPKKRVHRDVGSKGGMFVPTVKLDPSQVTDMRAQTGPRMVMRLHMRQFGTRRLDAGVNRSKRVRLPR